MSWYELALGYAASAATCCIMIPQIVKVVRTKKADAAANVLYKSSAQHATREITRRSAPAHTLWRRY